MISALVGLALIIVGVLHWVGTLSATVTLSLLTIGVGLLAILTAYPFPRQHPPI